MPNKKSTSLATAVIEQLEIERHVSPISVKGRPKTNTGIPVKYQLPENLIERFVAFMEDDDWLSLREEIGVLRSILSQTIDAWRDWQGVEQDPENPIEAPVSVKMLTELIENIGKMVERQHKMMYSANNLVTLEAAAIFALSIAALVNKFVKDPEEKVAVLEGVRQLMTVGAGFNLDLTVIRKLISPVKEDFNAD